jgi:DNA-binding NtrC family response regulator
MNKNLVDSIKADILIVDDIPENLDLLCQTLESFGYNVIAVPNGEMALKIAARTPPPDLILLDIIMPEMDGFETCRRLKSDKRLSDIPVIFITAKDEPESLVEVFRVGGVDYITKPFENEEVLVRVQTHLKIHHLTQELLKKNQQLEQEIATRKQAEDAREQAEAARQNADEQLSLISQREAERWGLKGFIGKSQTIAHILDDVNRLQKTETVSVLITGESGTGKELIARAIHRISLSYHAISFKTRPGGMKYFYQLIGKDDEWQGPTNKETAEYFNLNLGKYTFSVKGVDRDLNYSDTPAFLHIIIPPP